MKYAIGINVIEKLIKMKQLKNLIVNQNKFFYSSMEASSSSNLKNALKFANTIKNSKSCLSARTLDNNRTQ